MIVKIDGYKNDRESSSKTKVSKDIPSGFSMSKISSIIIEIGMMYIEVKSA